MEANLREEIKKAKQKLRELQKQEKILKNIMKKNKKELVYAFFLFASNDIKELQKSKISKINANILVDVLNANQDITKILAKIADPNAFIKAIADIQNKKQQKSNQQSQQQSQQPQQTNKNNHNLKAMLGQI